MVDRVVSTKLTEEEHDKLLDACNREGCTPSSLIKDAIMKRISLQDRPTETKPKNLSELLRRMAAKEGLKK